VSVYAAVVSGGMRLARKKIMIRIILIFHHSRSFIGNQSGDGERENGKLKMRFHLCFYLFFVPRLLRDSRVGGRA
jgi:hypothetical protein